MQVLFMISADVESAYPCLLEGKKFCVSKCGALPATYIRRLSLATSLEIEQPIAAAIYVMILLIFISVLSRDLDIS